VWEEVADAGYSRASFAFTLTDNYIGQARNGLATFVWDEAEISSVAIQITQETAPVDEYERVDFSALVPVTFDPECPAADQTIAEFQQELAGRLPLRRWSELPSADSSRATSRNGLADTDLSAVALLLDGQLYQQEVSTRSGPHPWPEWMRHGVFSVTKTLGLGLAMFHLAHRYGDDLFEERIVDHVPELADHPGWQGVTFEHVLSMVTGTAGSDEGTDIAPFIEARSARAKLAAIARLPDADSAPGTEFRYASTNSFVLSYALNRYVKAREGASADYWTMVHEAVLEPLGIPHLPLSRSLEPGAELGPPIMGWGSYPDVDAAAKVAQLLQNEGAHRGHQLLSRAKVREALRRTDRPGYATGNPAETYLHSVWTVRVDTGACAIDVPTMSGHGGNYVMILPSGLSVVRFMDANSYDVSRATQAAETYRSSCP
jgi:CubicO group peptidase (beta-lactamase class C family)